MRLCSRTSRNRAGTGSSSPAVEDRSVGSSSCSISRESGSTGSRHRHAVDVSAWWRKHLARPALGLYGDRLGELTKRVARNRYPTVYEKRREILSPGVFAFTALPQGSYGNLTLLTKLSIPHFASRGSDRNPYGCLRTPNNAVANSQTLLVNRTQRLTGRLSIRNEP
jgi:hypothetical protein